jgi:hypothetical protein
MSSFDGNSRPFNDGTRKLQHPLIITSSSNNDFLKFVHILEHVLKI